MKILQGKTVSVGIAIGKAFILEKKEYLIPVHKVEKPENELIRLQDAILKAKAEIVGIIGNTQNASSKEEIEIMEAYEAMLDDPDFLDTTKSYIIEEKMNAAHALETAALRFSNILDKLDDEYLKARANDIQDVSQRIFKYLLKIQPEDTQEMLNPSIIISSEITANDIVDINKELILGIVTSKGGYNDHAAILARAYSIPLVTGLNNKLSEIKQNDEIIIDGETGKVFLNPDPDTKNEKLRIRDELLTFRAIALENAFSDTKTTDGHKVEVCANIGGIESAEAAVKSGADSVGLFRSEFIFLNQSELPDEESQFQIYNRVAKCLNGKEIRLRTLDIGADKKLKSIKLQEELNPALGLRAIRLMFDREEELFKPQVKAILRAAKKNNIKIMLPMVSSINEIRKFKKLVSICQDELKKENKEFADNISIGIMVEVPSVAVLIDKFVEESDFFSIGTNDLTQYTLSADRTNYAVSSFNEGLHPAVLHLINKVVKSAHAKGKPVAICGELAADFKAIPIFIGLGVDELSVNPASIPTIKEFIRKISFAEAKKIAELSLQMECWEEIQKLTK